MEIKFDTERDNAYLPELYVIIQKLKAQQESISVEAEKESNVIPIKSLETKVVKPVEHKKAKLEFVFGENKLDDGTTLRVYPKKHNMENKAIRKSQGRGYSLKSPDGVIHIFCNMKSFCKENNLDYDTFKSPKFISSNGWERTHQYDHLKPYAV